MLEEEEEEDWFIVRGHTKGRSSSLAIHPAPLVLPDRATQVSRPRFSTALYGRLNNGWAPGSTLLNLVDRPRPLSRPYAVSPRDYYSLGHTLLVIRSILVGSVWGLYYSTVR